MAMRPAAVGIVADGIGCRRQARQQPIDPVDFRPFVDGGHWIVRQPLATASASRTEQITVPVGFVTDFASIPQALQSIIRQNGPYILPAVVHDYLYWDQGCTRDAGRPDLPAGDDREQGRRRFIAPPSTHAVAAAGSFAWDDNARERAAGMVRILPPDRQQITAATLWPLFRQEVMAAGVIEPPHAPIAPTLLRARRHEHRRGVEATVAPSTDERPCRTYFLVRSRRRIRSGGRVPAPVQPQPRRPLPGERHRVAFPCRICDDSCPDARESMQKCIDCRRAAYLERHTRSRSGWVSGQDVVGRRRVPRGGDVHQRRW